MTEYLNLLYFELFKIANKIAPSMGSIYDMDINLCSRVGLDKIKFVTQNKFLFYVHIFFIYLYVLWQECCNFLFEIIALEDEREA